MLTRTYISIQGPSFDPSTFEKVAGGRARRRKHSGAPLTDVSLDYWASSEKSGKFAEVEANLLGILSELVPHGAGLRKMEGIQVIAHVVVEFEPGDEPVGMHFSRDVMALLGEIGAALDIDAVARTTSGAIR